MDEGELTMRSLHHREILRPTMEELGTLPRHPVDVVVDNVRSLYNVGSIFRTCDGARVRKLWLCGFTPSPPRKEISKTALGAEDSVPWEYSPSIINVLSSLREEGREIIAVEHTDESRSCYETVVDPPLVLVVGNEITGLSPEALVLCHRAMEIPMYGMKQSLNVAVATGIIVYEMVRGLRQGRVNPESGRGLREGGAVRTCNKEGQ